MGFLEILTLVFIALKLMGFITWSWFFVLLPTIISITLYLVLVSLIFGGVISSFKFWKK